MDRNAENESILGMMEKHRNNKISKTLNNKNNMEKRNFESMKSRICRNRRFQCDNQAHVYI